MPRRAALGCGFKRPLSINSADWLLSGGVTGHSGALDDGKLQCVIWSNPCCMEELPNHPLPCYAKSSDSLQFVVWLSEIKC